MAAPSAEYQFQHNPTQMVITVIYLINKSLFNSCAISFWDCLSVEKSQTDHVKQLQLVLTRMKLQKKKDFCLSSGKGKGR